MAGWVGDGYGFGEGESWRRLAYEILIKIHMIIYLPLVVLIISMII
jgi:hypothetical protein